MPSKRSTFAEDKAFEERFRADIGQILTRLIMVSVAPDEDDWKHNTDYGLTIDVPTIYDNVLAVSARVRRYNQKERRNRQGRPYRRQFTVRHSRPSGIATERDKLLMGYGAVMIYGFESEPGADTLNPWIMLGLDKLREWDPKGHRYRELHKNKDGSSSLAVYWLEDLPRETLLRSEGIPRQVVGSFLDAKTDSRFEPYTRPDNYAESSLVHPDPKNPTGWLCPACGTNATTFYGQGPRFDGRRYDGPDERLCLACWGRAA